jgi:hypothetical protein
MTTNTVERALQLARSGEFSTLEEVVRRLKQEGLSNVEAHTSGPSIRAQLRREFVKARA